VKPKPAPAFLGQADRTAEVNTERALQTTVSDRPARKKPEIKLTPLVQHLRNQNKLLKLELLFHNLIAHQTMITGVSGEMIIATAIEGQLASYGAGYDIRKNGIKIEVKTSGLRKHSRFSLSLRWSWNKILGENGRKDYDYLILVGKKDPRYSAWYKDNVPIRLEQVGLR